ncbi:MAG: hypothetical protein U1F10_05685 [Burkholderiales bacterium]
MNTAVAKKFSVKPLVAAMAVTLSVGSAIAGPAPFQLPGQGLITGLTPGATFTSTVVGGQVQYLVSTGANPIGGTGSKGDQIYNGFTGIGGGIQINGVGKVRGVIQWGGWNPATTNYGSNLETSIPASANPAGFNIGRFAATNFSSGAGVTDAAILNIDGSGSPSFIEGQLTTSTLGGGVTPKLFVSNANGIITGPDSIIVAPNGIGLIGANLNNATAINEFLGNNSTGVSYIDITDGQARVETNGYIAGSATLNAPAAFVLLAGGDVVNTGTVFGTFVETFAGMRAVAGKATVNGVASTTVNRAWNVDASFYAFSTLALGVAGGVEIASATSSVVNTGSISVTTPGFGYLLSLSANGFRSGIQGNTDPFVGIFADKGLFIENYSSGSTVQLFNSVKGYQANTVLPFVQVNTDGGIRVPGTKGDILVEALTVGTLPSSITTTSGVFLEGDNITVNSTINHLLNSAGGVQGAADLVIDGKAITINKSIGAGDNVIIVGAGPITIAKGANVLSDTNKSGAGGILIQNNGNQAGNSTTIDGNLATSTASGSDITVNNTGIATSKVVINGSVTTHAGGDVNIYSDGNLELSGAITGSDDVNLTANGLSVALKGAVVANADNFNGFISFAAPLAQTKFYPTASFTAPAILLGYDDRAGSWTGTNTIQGVSASGTPYAKAADKPTTDMFVTNNIVAVLLGSFNAPIAGVTDWLQNSFLIGAQDPTVPVNISLSQMGGGPQFINMKVKGDVWIDSGLTATPFQNVGLTSGQFFPVGPLIGNGGSSLIVNASGALSVVSNSGAQDYSWVGGPGFNGGMGGAAFFQSPGGIALKAGDLLTVTLPVYNAFTPLALPYQGVWLESDQILALSYFATQGNARVNFSSTPQNPVPNIYVIDQTSPNTFGFLLKLDRAFLNTYSKAINGAPINNCPIGFVC